MNRFWPIATGLGSAGAAVVPVVRLLHEVIQGFCMGYGWDLLSPFIEFDSDRELTERSGWVAVLAFGLYLLFDGRWVIGRILRGLDGTCPKCGYDLKGVKGGVCPECGR